MFLSKAVFGYPKNSDKVKQIQITQLLSQIADNVGGDDIYEVFDFYAGFFDGICGDRAGLCPGKKAFKAASQE